jgi:hypothetical protein
MDLDLDLDFLDFLDLDLDLDLDFLDLLKDFFDFFDLDLDLDLDAAFLARDFLPPTIGLDSASSLRRWSTSETTLPPFCEAGLLFFKLSAASLSFCIRS